VNADDGLDHRAGVVGVGRGQVQPRQSLGDRRTDHDPTGVQHHQVVCQTRHLVQGMADI
jgi:hypothetical protein